MAIAQPPTQGAPAATQLASRDMVERYYRAHRLIGCYVLNMDGERIGEVTNLVLDERGDVKVIQLRIYDDPDADGGPIAVSPHRFEVVSAEGPRVMVLRTDLTREEVIHAQLSRLKSNARAPAERGAGTPDMHRDTGPFY